MSKYHDDNTEASDPGGISLDVNKLSYFKRELAFMDKSLFCTSLPQTSPHGSALALG